jgi:hypothetical protein
MRLREFLSGAATAATQIHRSPSQRALDAARREHDEWARTAKLGTPYYTVLPTLGEDLLKAGRINAVSHTSYTFDKRANWGVYTGQLMAGQTPSWSIWRQNGPLTLEQKWTHADQRRRDEEISEAFGRGMDQRVLERFLSERLREYPATAAILAA